MGSIEPRRGDIWLVSFGASRSGEPGKNRPGVVISVDRLNTPHVEDLIMVVPLSSSRAPSALRVEVSLSEGVERPSRAICRATRAVARGRLLQRSGTVSPETLGQIERALLVILGLDRPD